MGWLTLRRFVENALRARLTDNRVMAPFVATYHVTSYCNLNCSYCEDFGLRRNRFMSHAMPRLEDAMKILRVLRTSTENIILTGGEALLHPHIEEIVAYARRIGFQRVALITNGLLLPKREGILRHLTRLIISLDSLDPEAWDRVLGAGPGTAARIHRIVEEHAALQRRHGYRLIVNCVVMPGTVGMVRKVIDFCIASGVAFSISPQGLKDQPHTALVENEDYRALVRDLMTMKERGHDVMGSRLYLRHMLEFEEFQCYPTLNVRVMPNGDLIYPCRPIADSRDGRGGVGANLLEFDRFEDAFGAAVRRYGQPPKGCRSCFQQCFAEPSLLIRHPFSTFAEFRRYHATSRRIAGRSPGLDPDGPAPHVREGPPEGEVA